MSPLTWTTARSFLLGSIRVVFRVHEIGSKGPNAGDERLPNQLAWRDDGVALRECKHRHEKDRRGDSLEDTVHGRILLAGPSCRAKPKWQPRSASAAGSAATRAAIANLESRLQQVSPEGSAILANRGSKPRVE